MINQDKEHNENGVGNRLHHVMPKCLPTISGTMRLLRKRKALCVFLIGSLVILSVMVSHSVVMDVPGTIAINDLHYKALPPQDRRRQPGLIKYHSNVVVHDRNANQSGTMQCTPARNVAFVKTHKAGSTTVANILLRYGMVHNLNFALPNTKLHSYGYNYISRAGEVLSKDFILPLPAGQEYNILFNHAIYNRTAFQLIMPANTAYITILREPFQQFVSTFEYYHLERYFAKKGFQLPDSMNPISTFLKKPSNYDKSTALFSYIRNKQSEDLGLNKVHYFNPNKLKEYIEAMDRDFTLVMILEYFDESLLLLRHELCWGIRDILYIPHNANRKKPKRNFTETDHMNHRKMSHVDYELYTHFFKVFWEKLKAQSQDFFQELAHFKSLLLDVKQSCSTGRAFYVQKSQWHEAFFVNKTDCSLLMMPELVSLDLLYRKTASKFKLGPNAHKIVRYGKKTNSSHHWTIATPKPLTTDSQ